MSKFDSGYTLQQIEATIAGLIDAPAREAWGGRAALTVGIELGLIEGDVVEESDAGTVLLSESREALDFRLATVRAMLAKGATLPEAMAKLVE